MSANKFIVLPPTEIECFNAGNAKTVLAVKANVNIPLKILGWSISFDGTSITAAPMNVELSRQTTSGTMASTVPVKLGTNVEVVQATASFGASAEPSKGDVLDTFDIHPQAGFDVKYPEGEQPIIPPDGRVGIIVKADMAINCSVKMICEE